MFYTAICNINEKKTSNTKITVAEEILHLNRVTGNNLACIISVRIKFFHILELRIYGITTPKSSRGISWEMTMTFTNVIPQRI